MSDIEVHMTHCNRDDLIGSCKYGESDCPALADGVWKEPREQFGSTIKLLVPLSMVPDKSVVSKKTGTKMFTISREVKIFTLEEGGLPQKIKPEKGTVFLLDGIGNINACAETSEHIWYVNTDYLAELLNRDPDWDK